MTSQKSYTVRSGLILIAVTLLLNACEAFSPASPTPTPGATPTATTEPGLQVISDQDFGLPAEAQVWVLPNEHTVDVAYSPDGKYLAASATSGIFIYTTKPLAKVTLIEDYAHLYYAMAWAPDSRQLALGSKYGTVRIWDIETGYKQTVFRSEYQGYMLGLDWSPDGRRLASASGSTRTGWAVQIWDVETGHLDARFETFHPPLSLAWSPDGSYLASSHVAEAHIWNMGTLTEAHELNDPDIGMAEELRGATWSPDSKWLATAGAGGSVFIWNPATGGHVATIHGDIDADHKLEWWPDGSKIVTGGYDAAIHIWDSRSTLPIAKLNLSSMTDNVYSLSLSPDGKTIAICLYEGYLIFWDVERY